MDASDRRNAVVEAKLRGIAPIASQAHLWELYLSRDGFYLLRYHGGGRIYFLAVSAQTGELKDLTTLQPADQYDLQHMCEAFSRANLPQMTARTEAWFRSQPR
jgi:hypothetical protein